MTITILLETSSKGATYVPMFLLVPLARALYRRVAAARGRRTNK